MANLEDQYRKEFEQLLNNAKKLSDSYEAANPDCTIKLDKKINPNYRSNEYRTSALHSWKGESYFKLKCPRCGSSDAKETKINAGCRMNGDAYGAYVKTCGSCGCFDFSFFDEQSSD